MRYRLANTFDPERMIEGRIECYPWGGAYRPETRFRAGWTKNGIRVLMQCQEANPLRRVREKNGPVWRDSCMEFFLAPGDRAQDGYFNFEMNANGALFLGFGYSDTDFAYCDFPREQIALKAEICIDRWALDLTVPVELIRDYFPKFELKAGRVLRGNFYKCGDETEEPHFGCYFPIDSARIQTPCFHVPQYYGELELTKQA